jgi:maleylpyruvate isomerase
VARLCDDPALAVVLVLLDEQTGLLLGTAQTLDDAAMRAPSRLPGWSRGHVLTHLARNADGLRGVLIAAAAGEPASMYPSWQARDADIESGAGRPAAVLIDDAGGSAEALREALRRHPDDPEARFTSPAGWWRPIRDVPWFRCREVVLHHVDLGTGFTLARAPEVAERLVAETVELFAERDGVPGLDLVATDTDRRWRLRGGGPVIAGTTPDLAGWLTGRADGSTLSGGGPLPTLPPWA